MSIVWRGSPNYTKGRGGNTVNKIVIHWMAGNLAGADATFQNTARQTSAHFGIENYAIYQWVAEEDTAWHSGNFVVNQTTVGIEHSAAPDRPASEATYRTSAALIADICRRYNLPINANTVIPHRAIVATQCPGTIDLAKLITMAQAISGGDMYNGKTAEQWYRDWKGEHDVNVTREDYLNRIGFAEGSGSGAIEGDDVDRIIAGIDRRNKEIELLKKQLAAQAVDLAPGVYRVK